MNQIPSLQRDDHDEPPVRRSIDLTSMFSSEEVIF